MALFKIFKGPSEKLKEISPTEGYAYFTPDDGRFYIDIKDDLVPHTGISTQESDMINRICINSTNSINGLILDCGVAGGWYNEPPKTFVYNTGDSNDTGENLPIYDGGDSKDNGATATVVTLYSGTSLYPL